MNSSRFPKGKFNAVIGKLYYQTSNKTVCLNVFLRYKETHVDLDAANDAHSGLVIFNRFSKMAKAMPSIPKPSYYSFDSINGRLFDSAGIAWSPSNPEYDPGPPPPPKPPRPPKPTTATNGRTDKAPASASVQVYRPPPKPK